MRPARSRSVYRFASIGCVSLVLQPPPALLAALIYALPQMLFNWGGSATGEFRARTMSPVQGLPLSFPPRRTSKLSSPTLAFAPLLLPESAYFRGSESRHPGGGAYRRVNLVPRLATAPEYRKAAEKPPSQTRHLDTSSPILSAIATGAILSETSGSSCDWIISKIT